MEWFMNKALEAENFSLKNNQENDKDQVSFQFYIEKTLEYEKKNRIFYTQI